MDDLKTNPGVFLSLLLRQWQKYIQSTLFPHGMPSVALHLLVTGSLYELVASFQKPGLVLPLCAQGLALGTCCCSNITSFTALTLSHTWALLSITQQQRDRGDTELAAIPMCWQHCWLNWCCCLPAVPSHLFWRTNICFAPWWPG